MQVVVMIPQPKLRLCIMTFHLDGMRGGDQALRVQHQTPSWGCVN
jgi:hypothetical protein